MNTLSGPTTEAATFEILKLSHRLNECRPPSEAGDALYFQPNQIPLVRFEGCGFTQRLEVLSFRKLVLCGVLIVRADWTRGKGRIDATSSWHHSLFGYDLMLHACVIVFIYSGMWSGQLEMGVKGRSSGGTEGLCIQQRPRIIYLESVPCNHVNTDLL